VGTVRPSSKEQEGQARNCFFEAAGSDNLANQQFRFRGRPALQLLRAAPEQN
jgi:hypothetical protein